MAIPAIPFLYVDPLFPKFIQFLYSFQSPCCHRMPWKNSGDQSKLHIRSVTIYFYPFPVPSSLLLFLKLSQCNRILFSYTSHTILHNIKIQCTIPQYGHVRKWSDWWLLSLCNSIFHVLYPRRKPFLESTFKFEMTI